MRSIDSLREYAANAPDASMSPMAKAIVAGLADSIEREVEEARDRDYRNGREDAGGAAEFADRLCRASELREDVTLWGVDYVALPVDADGVPVRVGDVMEWPDHSTAEVVGIGDGTFFYVEDGEDAAEWSCAFDKIHHHESTVEDVLREFADRYLDYEGIPSAGRRGIGEALMAECAAKLQLKEG